MCSTLWNGGNNKRLFWRIIMCVCIYLDWLKQTLKPNQWQISWSQWRRLSCHEGDQELLLSLTCSNPSNASLNCTIQVNSGKHLSHALKLNPTKWSWPIDKRVSVEVSVMSLISLGHHRRFKWEENLDFYGPLDD